MSWTEHYRPQKRYLAKGISRAVAEILGDRARVISLEDSIKLKGKADGFEILTLDELER